VVKSMNCRVRVFTDLSERQMRTRSLSLLVVAFSLILSACEGWSRKNYNVDKPSPTGTYRVKFEDTVVEKGIGEFDEKGKLQILYEAEVVDSRSWDYSERWESTIAASHESIEWESNNVLRMGAKRDEKSLFDSLIISNTSAERIKYASILTDRYETFSLFDVPAGQEIVLKIDRLPSEAGKEGTREFLSCNGKSSTNKRWSAKLRDVPGTVGNDGSTTFRIIIKQEDLN
jgi:hypothetical protein